MSRNRGLVLCGWKLEELIYGRLVPRFNSKSRIYNLTEEQQRALSWAMNAMAWRRLVGTENGRLGLATGAAESGDKVAVQLVAMCHCF
jgi:hypothetical protein